MPILENLERTVQVAETSEFTGIFGSAARSQWFATLMANAGTYLFTAALIFNLLKFGFSLYRYTQKSTNKNVNEKSSLLWNGLQLGLVGTAIAGTLLLGTVFALATPILFVAAMGSDALRNIGMLGWNIFKFAQLYFTTKKTLADTSEDDSVSKALTTAKYEALKKQYIAKIKQHAIGAAIGTVVTAAATVIFLFPHVGLAAAAATGVVVGGVKVTVASIAGVVGATAMLAPLVVPLLKKAGTGIVNGIKHLWNRSKSPAVTNKNDNKPLLHSVQPEIMIRDEPELIAAMNHKLDFKAYTKDSQFREIVIKHIDQSKPDLAIKTIMKWVEKKIGALEQQIKDGETAYFEKRQQPKRQEKIDALKKIQAYFNKEVVQVEHQTEIKTIDGLVEYIERAYPDVKDSFFRDQSDTQNIIEAVKAFGAKFKKEQAELPEPDSVANSVQAVAPAL